MTVPIALSIAGSDPSGGAGIQADLKTFSALGAYGTAVITALTAQNTTGVTGVHVVPAGFVTEQLETLVADVSIDAVKIGMLANAKIVGAVAGFLARQRYDLVVLDPVMVATSGDRLLSNQAADAMRGLLPAASVITPNLAEAAVLLLHGPVAASVAAMHDQAHALLALGAQRVLLKGGHLPGGDGGGGVASAEMVDVFLGPEGEHELRGPRVARTRTAPAAASPRRWPRCGRSATTGWRARGTPRPG